MANPSKQELGKPAKEKPVGPYLSAALIAETMLTEKDTNRTSIIRVADKIAIATDVAAGIKDDVVTFALVLLISFRGGGYKGTSRLLVTEEGPNQDDGGEPIGWAEFKFGETHIDLWEVKIEPLSIKWHGIGRYWFDVYLDSRLCTRIPFEITADLPEKKP